MKKISLIGSTGSIGSQTCSVVRRYGDKFRFSAMVAGSNGEKFLSQIREFKPEYAVMINEAAGESIREYIPEGVKFAVGEEAAVEAVEAGDVCLVAASGFAGLKYSLRALESGKRLALANKETLVCGGSIVMPLVKKLNADIAPVDSEHSAIWQALGFDINAPFKKLIITASGGPFYSYTPEMLEKVTPADALKHPTWKMGAKITIDSATLLNKGFEVIEAEQLYSAPLNKIETVVQPESMIHSMVEFDDGAIIAQLSRPTMELPIQLALTYPERFPADVEETDFSSLGAIRFLPLERKRFPCYDMALTAAEYGGDYPCALNGAAETAVNAFLRGRISFTSIKDTIEYVLNRLNSNGADSYESLVKTDGEARQLAAEYINKRK